MNILNKNTGQVFDGMKNHLNLPDYIRWECSNFESIVDLLMLYELQVYEGLADKKLATRF